MSRHDGVSCDACLKGNFKGRRYKCLICFDYDLCSTCYETGGTTNQHTTNHPMQCILTRHDFDIFHGGEALTADQPQSLTCPFCGKMGFTEATLQEHVTANHADTVFEVVCPICASVPGGDPNHMTDDFAAHLTLDHPTGVPRELDITESGTRQGMRRMPHQGRGLTRGVARQNMRSVSSGFFSSSSRGDSMDPIAELLSQLSGVRRTTAATRQQHLERLPNRRSGAGTSGVSGAANNSAGTAGGQAHNSNVANGNAGGPGNSSAGGLASNINNSGANVGTTQSGVVMSLGGNSSNSVSAHHPPPSLVHSTNKQQGQSQFLLGRLSEMESEQENPCEVRDRASFVQELLLSTLSELTLCTQATPTTTTTALTTTTAATATEDTTTTTTTTPTQPPLLSTTDASTQTSSSSHNNNTTIGGSTTPTTNSLLNSSSTISLCTKTPPSSTAVPPLSGTKGGGGGGGGGGGCPKTQPQTTTTKMLTRSSPGMTPTTTPQQQPQQPSLQQSNGSNLGSGRVVTGTGTVSVPPPVGGGGGGPGRGRAAGGSVSPGAGRRKPVRGLEGRTTQPPPPH